MTWLLIGAGVWLALFVVVWTLCVAAGRADACAEDRRLERAALEPVEVAPVEVAPPVAPEVATPVVAEVSALDDRLQAAAVLLDAERVAVMAASGDGEHEIAAAALSGIAPRGAEARFPLGVSVALVASRASVDRRFDDAELALLRAIAGSLRDVVVAAQPSDTARSGRFGRDMPRRRIHEDT